MSQWGQQPEKRALPVDVKIINWCFLSLCVWVMTLLNTEEKNQVPGDLSGPEASPLSNPGHKPRVVALNGDPSAWEAEVGGLPSV